MSETTPTLIGRIPDNSGKRPKTIDEPRVCRDEFCETKLSRYNTKDLCYRHRPSRYPRVRGRPR